MTGPVEEAGKVATGIIDALKAQPAVLALSLAQIAMLVFLFYALAKAAEFREQSLKNQYEMMRETQLLLSKCVVPDKSGYTMEPLKPIGEVEEPHKEP
jgi:F420-0:gamma-glutamyl ligase-like protein